MATSNRRKQEDSSTSLVYHSRHVPESKEEASPVVENGNALNDPNDVSFSEEISQIHSNRSSIVQKKPISPISHQSKQNTFMNQQFEMLEEQSDMFTRKIETEKRKIEDLEKKIKVLFPWSFPLFFFMIFVFFLFFFFFSSSFFFLFLFRLLGTNFLKREKSWVESML